MTFEECFNEHKKLVDDLDSVRRDMKKFEDVCSVQDIQEGQVIPGESKNCNEWNKLLEREIGIVKQLISLSEECWGQNKSIKK